MARELELEQPLQVRGQVEATEHRRLGGGRPRRSTLDCCISSCFSCIFWFFYYCCSCYCCCISSCFYCIFCFCACIIVVLAVAVFSVIVVVPAFFSCCCLFFVLFSGEPCFQERQIRFRILRPSPFIHTERRVTGPCRKLLARYFGSPGSSQSQRPAERRVPQSFYCSSTLESERKDIVPSYDIFVTQRVPLGSASRQCYCVFQQQLQLEGVQPHVLRKLCFSTAASTLTPGWRGGYTVFLLGLVTQFFLLRPIIRQDHSTGEEGFSSISPLSRQNLDRFFPSLLPRRRRKSWDSIQVPTCSVFGSADATAAFVAAAVFTVVVAAASAAAFIPPVVAVILYFAAVAELGIF